MAGHAKANTIAAVEAPISQSVERAGLAFRVADCLQTQTQAPTTMTAASHVIHA